MNILYEILKKITNKKKLVVGIDINEILRAKWLQFDRFYYQEFGESGVPLENPYTYDYFKSYKWEDTIEENKELREDAPENINPLDYRVDEETGEAPADFLLFKKTTTNLTAKEMFNRFMYEDFCFEIFGSAPVMYKNMELDIEKFYNKYSNYVEFVIISKENWFSIPPTLYFLSRTMSRFKNYKFVNNTQEMLDSCDVLISTDPEVFEMMLKKNQKTIRLDRQYNNDNNYGNESLVALQLNDLTDNKEFENIIGF